MTHHPDHEQLAAFQAGDDDRRQRADVEAHLAGCPSCAEVVASVDRARGRLALLEEPDLPPGLHDRLATAVAGETEVTGDLPRRPTPWYRRPAAWGAAAALLLAALVVPFLDQAGDDRTTAGGSGGGAELAQRAGSPAEAAGAIPVFRVPGEVSSATVRSRLSADTRAKAALDAAQSGVPGTQAATPRDSQPPAPNQSVDEDRRPSLPAPESSTTALQPCLPAAAGSADPATRPLVPAFYLQGTYDGRPATILVTTSTGQPGRVDLWVFPRDDCSSPPLEAEQVS